MEAAGSDAGAAFCARGEAGAADSAVKDLVVGAAIGRFFLRGRWSRRAKCGIAIGTGRGGGSDRRILRTARWVIDSGGMLENAACVLSDAFHARGVGRVGSLDATIVGAGGFFDVAAEMIEKAAEQQASVRSEHSIIHRVQLQLARRP